MKVLSKIGGIAFAVGLACSTGSQAQNIVYVIPYFDLPDSGQTNVFIRETRTGTQVTAAEIDFCYRHEPEGKWDRAVIPLQTDGTRFTGMGSSQIGKTAITVEFVRNLRERNLIYFDGTIKIGGKSAVAPATNYASEHTELGFIDQQSYINIEENPAGFTEVSPQELAVRFKRGELEMVLDALRGEPVLLKPRNGLVQDCSVLRNGYQTLELTIAPDKAAGVIAKLRKLPAVLAAGWSGYSHITHATRLPVSDWGAGGKLDRDKLAAELVKSVSRALGATLKSSKWDAQTGELAIVLTRPSERFQEARFSEELDVRLLAVPESPAATEYFILWVVSASVTVVDTDPSALKIEPFEIIGGEGVQIDQEKLAQAVTKDLRGPVWDQDTKKWK